MITNEVFSEALEQYKPLINKFASKFSRNYTQKEEVEAIDEVKMADLPARKIQGRAYGASKPEPHAVDTIKGPNDAELKKIEAEKKKKKFYATILALQMIVMTGKKMLPQFSKP